MSIAGEPIEIANARRLLDRLAARFAYADRILEDAERFATLDPGVDWPSAKHTDPVDAICAALDELRERQAWEED